MRASICQQYPEGQGLADKKTGAVPLWATALFPDQREETEDSKGEGTKPDRKMTWGATAWPQPFTFAMETI